MKKIRSILMAFLTFALVLSLPAEILRAEEDSSETVSVSQTTSDNLNYDVIFVIDGSGSMAQSDPQRQRLTAGQLFTELAASDTSRAGYVQFTNYIKEEEELTELSTEEAKEAFRTKLENIPDSTDELYSDTDIALGLTEALCLLKEGGSFDGDRNPVIILLSDGNTDLPNGPRSEEVSEEELELTLAECVSLGVPIYAIGLNWNGELDIDNMKSIADQTGGEYYNTTSATEFNQCMTDIFGNVSDGESTPLDPVYEEEEGRYYTDFVIDNGSVLYAYININTNEGVSDPQLTDPYGNEVTLDEAHGVTVTEEPTYTILKIKSPDQGIWTVSVKGGAQDDIKITLITSYDIAFEITGTEDAVAGDEITLTGRLVRGTEEITDEDLLEGAVATCQIRDADSNIVGEDLEMNYDAVNHVFTYMTVLDKSGNYYVDAHLEGKDGVISKDADQYKLSVGLVPLTVLDSVSKTMWCTPVKTRASFDIEDYLSCESLVNLECTIADVGESMVEAEYDPDTGKVTLTPRETGSGEVVLDIRDEYGQSAQLEMSVKIYPSWIWFVLGLFVVILLLTVILLVRRARRPLLQEPVTVELELPPVFLQYTPAPATLSMPAGKTEVKILDLILEDPLAKNTFGDALNRTGLMPFLDKVKLVAGKKGAVTLKILPKTPGMVTIRNFNQDVNPVKGAACPLRKGEKLGLQYSPDGGVSKVTFYMELGNGNYGFSADMNNPFGNGGGFGDPFNNGGSFGNPFGFIVGGFCEPFGC
ncbi:MAG: VWA domain-containing protein [Clostridiales bacterium]|nr:VWA domain-containing protein [Clostridiales bacterium]